MRPFLVLLPLCLLAAAPPASKKELLHIPVWAASDGGSRAALSVADLKVTVGGTPVIPAGILGPGDDLMLLVISDLTGDLTMAGIAKRALTERIAAMPASAMVGAMTAQNGLRVIVDPTLERAPVAAAIEALPVSGKAGLLETIVAAGKLGDAVLAKASVRLAILYITDSDVYNYREDFTNPTVNWTDANDISRRFRDGLVRERISKLDATMAAVEAPVFIVHLAYSTDALNQAYQTGLMTLASTTGGAAYFCRSQAEVSDTIGKVFEGIRSHHSLRLPLPPASSGSVEIVLENPGRPLTWRRRISVPK